ncbi:MAG: DNA/RNA non-specific endonuclease [Saprospiraceae bacterium]|nr:DNA/RNA non-specific endonuclease [Saprospiraceae bacterium]MCF8248588.1 DNA/RNA non-specific endonuclease [Saprospiraceae bacterium]MCF8281026.1 DNA/RNA non-specific endonuclease [Bacteroidales bacterium]MCF8310321.1 DNA/RNA non-specific endonuclease [Saprospiraceae bacterium]MCF8443126.1 DNA/RNA non-specific endonuclease [Saprospiraceae bacterium]
MANFRKNHTKSSKAESSGLITKVGMFAVLMGIIFWGFQKFMGGDANQQQGEALKADVENLEETSKDSIFYLPTNPTGAIVQHKYYALSYVEKYELPEWCAYELTADRLNKKWVQRTNDFRPDPKVETGSATLDDYRRSRYDRGHIVPAADMAFSEEAMSETFFMSNISPQESGFNKGVWRELEELTRDWAKRFKHLYVVTGPVLSQPIKFWIGESQVAVAPSYYKVLLDLSEPELKAIGFIIPNQTSTEPLSGYAVSVDEVEALTGIDFFQNLMEPNLEKKLEANFDVKLWPTNEKKFQRRVQEWNFQ